MIMCVPIDDDDDDHADSEDDDEEDSDEVEKWTTWMVTITK
jgi:hypothetical protein